MSDESEKLEHFKSVTGANDERARFFLDSASGSLELAITSFFDGEADGNSDVEIIDPPQPAASEPKPKPQAKKASSNFATIHSLNSSSDEEEEGQAFYAGGSEHSGQQVLGPKKKDFVQEMFKSVKQHGIEVLDEKPSSSSKAFKGTGYKLGQTDNDSEAVPGAPEPSRPVQVSLKLWRDGFSVDNGNLRLYSDPANQEFLNSVRRGEIPHELRKGYSEVHVIMEDHKNENFSPASEPRSRHVFQGAGHTLGSPTPPTIGAPCPDDQQVNESNAKQCLKLDKTKPTTNLQIRLADGTRMVGEFNHEHTVEEIRNYIISARPQFETRSFTLLGAFPPRELENSQTIAEAGLLNSAIIQKLT